MNKTTLPEKEQPKQTKMPDEKAGILVQSKIKIYDPETGKVFINQKA